MRINVHKIADGVMLALPTMSLVINEKGFMKCEDYSKEGETRTTVNDLRNINAYDFVNMMLNDLKEY